MCKNCKMRSHCQGKMNLTLFALDNEIERGTNKKIDNNKFTVVECKYKRQKIEDRREVVNMKKVNMMVYPPEKVYQNYTSTRLQKVTWGGAVQ